MYICRDCGHVMEMPTRRDGYYECQRCHGDDTTEAKACSLCDEWAAVDTMTLIYDDDDLAFCEECRDKELKQFQQMIDAYFDGKTLVKTLINEIREGAEL